MLVTLLKFSKESFFNLKMYKIMNYLILKSICKNINLVFNSSPINRSNN